MFNERVSKIAILALAAIYAAFRFWHLTDSCLWFDEIFSVHAAEHPWGEILPFVAKDLIHPPLFYLLLKLWIAAGGESLFWLRLFPVVLSILALFPLWMLCRELRLKPPAIIVSFGLFAVNGALIKYAQEVRMYSLLLFLSLMSIWLFSRYYFRGKSFWVLVIVNILLVYTHYFGWLVVGTEVLSILIAQRIKILRTLLMLAVTAAAFVPWLIGIYSYAEPGTSIKQNIGWMQRPGIGSLFEFAFDLIDPLYFQQSSVDAGANYLIAVPLLLLIAAAKIIYLLHFKDEANKERYFLLSMFAALPVFLIFVLSWILPVSLWGSRHLLIVFGPTIVLVALYLTEIVPAIFRTLLIASVLSLTAAAFAVGLRAAPPKYIWCAWEDLVSDIPKDDMQTLFVFEDLVAYHLWFATRSDVNVRVVKVEGMSEIAEDAAYFLPRGFDRVTRTSPEKISGEKFWILFRDPQWNEKHAPLNYFLERGFAIGAAKSIDVNGQKAFMVEVRK